MDKPSNPFKEAVERRLAALKRDQKDLARRLKIAQPTVSKALSSGNPTLETIVAYAAALECQAWELMRSPGADATPAPQTPDVATLATMLAEREKRIKELEAGVKRTSHISPENDKHTIPAAPPAELTGIPGEIRELLARAPEGTDWEHMKKSIESAFVRDKIRGKKGEEDAG